MKITKYYKLRLATTNCTYIIELIKCISLNLTLHTVKLCVKYSIRHREPIVRLARRSIDGAARFFINFCRDCRVSLRLPRNDNLNNIVTIKMAVCMVKLRLLHIKIRRRSLHLKYKSFASYPCLDLDSEAPCSLCS